MARLGLLACCVVLAAACEDPPPAATLTEVPAQFVGEWNATADDCGQGGPHAVTVTPTEVVMEETKVAVTGVAPDGRNVARVDGHFTGPGRTWDGSVRLEVSEGGRELSVVSGSPVVPRVKCP